MLRGKCRDERRGRGENHSGKLHWNMKKNKVDGGWEEEEEGEEERERGNGKGDKEEWTK
jgi:hypothetical protein